MAERNPFVVLRNRLLNIENKKLEVLKERAKIAAEPFNEFLIRWLKNRDYPLRPEARGKFRNDDTARLWGGKHLWQAQYVNIQKTPKRDAVSVAFLNKAPHARYFFPKVKPHGITAKNRKKPLAFHWGKPLPWTEQDGGGPGLRLRSFVNHPGHINYRQIVVDEFKNHEKGFEKARDQAVTEIFDL